MKYLPVFMLMLLIATMTTGCYHPDSVQCSATIVFDGVPGQGTAESYYTRDSQLDSVRVGCNSICQGDSTCANRCMEQTHVAHFHCVNTAIPTEGNEED